ncbi:unnamed protein product [Fusarium graminearum]|nr:unnamed protein product [Fusarium graminearum]
MNYSQLFNLLVQAFISVGASDASAALKCMCDEHAMVGEEPAALNNIVAATGNKCGAYDAHNLGEEIVMLLEGARVRAVDLQLRVCPEEARDLKSTEKIGMKDILGPGTSLSKFKEKSKTCVLIILLLRSA